MLKQDAIDIIIIYIVCAVRVIWFTTLISIKNENFILERRQYYRVRINHSIFFPFDFFLSSAHYILHGGVAPATRKYVISRRFFFFVFVTRDNRWKKYYARVKVTFIVVSGLYTTRVNGYIISISSSSFNTKKLFNTIINKYTHSLSHTRAYIIIKMHRAQSQQQQQLLIEYYYNVVAAF